MIGNKGVNGPIQNNATVVPIATKVALLEIVPMTIKTYAQPTKIINDKNKDKIPLLVFIVLIVSQIRINNLTKKLIIRLIKFIISFVELTGLEYLDQLLLDKDKLLL